MRNRYRKCHSNRNCVQIAQTLLLLLLLLLCCITESKAFQRYRFKLDAGNPRNLCPSTNSTCGNGQQHYLCKKSKTISADCSNYQRVDLRNKDKRMFVDAHNGIRNKVAEDFNIGNMNLVYWSDELAVMANRFLLQCRIEKDTCLLVGEKALSVNENYLFRRRPLADRWPGRVVRQWYLEIGYNVKSWQQFLQKRQAGNMQNFTQIVWPPLEFVGCGAAKMFGGIFIACYYNPSYEVKQLETVVSFGKPCTECQRNRPTCSKTFVALCGVDFSIPDGANSSQSNVYIFVMCMQLIAIASSVADSQK